MKHVISFFVEGDPQGQPRHRSAILKTKLGPKLHNYAKTTKFFMRVVRAARQHAPEIPLDGPLSVDLFFRFKAKAGTPFTAVWMDQKPDRDNLDKGVLDALTRAKFWNDDCQVCEGGVKKQWARPGERGGVYVSVWRLLDSDAFKGLE